jgi:tRNA G37 N-methylase Trm5
VCSRCALPIVGGCAHNQEEIQSGLIFPKADQIAEGMPAKAQSFLTQALECVHAPSGAIMLCASAVDSMLKEKGLKSGSLYARIETAAEQNLITKEMSLWAHEVRLDANDERHADEAAALPTVEDAKRCINFVKALADFLFILPATIAKGRASK